MSAAPITDAVVPAAGLGTRMAELTKGLPKEMLPVAGRPVIRHVVDELMAAGMRRILVITAAGKHAIEDHFDGDEELGARIVYARQPEPRGLGDAILCAEAFAEGRPFAVALGDAIVTAPVVSPLVAAFSEHRAACALAVEEVADRDTSRYGIVAPDGDGPSGEVFSVADLVEKPPPGEAPSNLAIAARYVFGPRIFAALRATPPGAGGELQLTDAIRRLLAEGGRVVAVRARATRFDVGTPDGYRAALAALDAQRAG